MNKNTMLLLLAAAVVGGVLIYKAKAKAASGG